MRPDAFAHPSRRSGPESGTPATRSASAGKECARAAPPLQPCLIDAHIIDVAVEAGKIDVFENAVRPFFLLQAFIRKNAVAGDGHDLTRFDITDKFAADRGDGTAFRCHDPDISLLPRQRGRRPNGSRTPISLRGLEIIRA